jgi:hypothetical protein
MAFTIAGLFFGVAGVLSTGRVRRRHTHIGGLSVARPSRRSLRAAPR